MSKQAALAIVAHPDDVEFTMAGTLLLLKDKGFDIHFWNLANGSYGSMVHPLADIIRIRAEEGAAGAKLAGATYHPAITDDLAILYRPEFIAKITAVVRAVKPSIIFTHSPQDYMEDHMNAARLTVTGTFIRAAPNYVSDPPVPAWAGDTVVYHAVPHGLKGPLRETVHSEIYVDIATTLARKGAALAAHKSQQEWLEATQGMGSMVGEMEEFSAGVGALSGRFAHAEGFRRHLHFGFANEAFDPLSDALGDKAWRDPDYGKTAPLLRGSR